MELDQELATYERERRRLLVDAGRFAVIKGDTVASIWDTRRDALQEGYRLYGPDEPFLVQKIEAVDPVIFIPWGVLPYAGSDVTT